MHFVAPYHRYIHTLSKHCYKMTRGGQVCFSTWLFLDHAKWHWKASAGVNGLPEGFNKPRMAWTQIISYMLALSSVVVCDWCGDLFGIWLELGVPLGIFFPTGSLSPPLTPTTHLLLISTAPDHYSCAVKASQNQTRQTIRDDISLSTWS